MTQRRTTQMIHQHVSQSVFQKTEGIRHEPVATGAISLQSVFQVLDAVLHVTATSIK
jgi:hypothetical protein